MDFTLENFDFKVNTLNSVAEIDSLLAEYAIQIKGYTAKLTNREFQQDKSEFRSDNLDEDIAEVQALIASKETELATFAAGTRNHEEIASELEGLRVRLRRLNFRKTETVSPFALVEKNVETGEAQLLLLYFTRFKEALEQRKAQL